MTTIVENVRKLADAAAALGEAAVEAEAKIGGGVAAETAAAAKDVAAAAASLAQITQTGIS